MRVARTFYAILVFDPLLVKSQKMWWQVMRRVYSVFISRKSVSLHYVLGLTILLYARNGFLWEERFVSTSLVKFG